MKNITVLYNKPKNISEASDVDTQDSALKIADNLAKIGYVVQTISVGQEDISKIRNIKTDLIFNLIEWTGQELNSAIAAIRVLEKSKIAFTGSGSWGYAVSDKLKMKRLMKRYKIPTPQLKFPAIVKPAYEHCGIGVGQNGIARNEEELKILSDELKNKYDQPVIAEEFIDGREIQVTVLEKHGRPWVLPPAEIIFDQKENFWPILSYEGKWDKKSWEYGLSRVVPAELNDLLMKKIEEMAVKCYRVLGGRDYPRLDMRIRGEEVFVLEMNNNPGVDFELDAAMGVSARLAGFTSFGMLLGHIAENAYARNVMYDADFV